MQVVRLEGPLVYVLATKLLLCSASNTCNCIDAKVKPVCIRILWAQHVRELKHRHFWDADGLWKDDVTTVTFGAKLLFSWFFFRTCRMLKGKELSSTISPLHLRNGYTSSSVHNNSNDKFSWKFPRVCSGHIVQDCGSLHCNFLFPQYNL